MSGMIAQLDPASLGLWYQFPATGDAAADEVMEQAANAALNGDEIGLLKALDEAKAVGADTRAAAFASTIWHEMRHFADTLLTNYGSFKLRRYLSLYVNLV